MKEFTYEQMQSVMFNELVNAEPGNIDDISGFYREFGFQLFGSEYKVVWYKNLSTLESGNLIVNFFSVELSNTYPSHHNTEMKLQFRDVNGDVVATLPVKYYSTGQTT